MRKTVWFCLFLIAFSFLVVLPIPKVYAVFTYGNWNWNGTDKILTMIANSTNNEGNTEVNAYDSNDIVNAINSNGWSAEYNQTGTQFTWYFRIVEGDGTSANTTWFVDSKVQWVFSDNVLTITWQIFFEIKNYAYAIFGTLENLNTKTTSQGVSFIDLESTYNHYLFRQISGSDYHVYFYSCHMIASRYTSISCKGNVRFWNTILTENLLISDMTGSNIFNTIIVKGAYYGVTYPRGTYDRFSIYETTYTMLITFTATLKNLYARRNIYIFRALNLDSDVYLINVDSSSWATVWAGTSSAEVYRQYEFDLTVTYQNGTAINGTSTGTRAVIQHYGEGGAVDYNATLGEYGTIPTQTLNKGFYNQTGANTIYSYEPYNLRIYNTTGYDIYSKNFSLNEKTTWEIALNEESVSTISFDSTYFLLGAVTLMPFIPIGYVVRRKRKNGR